MNNLEILYADKMGFCIGVKNAVSSAEKILEKTKNLERKGSKNTKREKIYSTGPIIHNDFINKKLKNLGLIYVRNLNDVPSDSNVIIRSHGETEKFYDRAKKRDIKIIDLTCPFVKKIQNLAKKNNEKGFNIVIIGDEKHPEVKGVLGWARAYKKNERRSIKDIADLKNFLKNYNKKKKYIFLAQTTFNLEKFSEIKKILEKENNDNFQIINTICEATKKRQDGAKELAKKVEAMVVIGDTESSNSKKLFEIAKKYCKNSFFISGEKNLILQKLVKYSIIGVTAGASVPVEIIKNVRRKLINGGK
ncbi:MAG: 4-hydroxy-3-methylbut-2-enyl diphosphate reductase [Clostridiales Family XIII bacterium]|nr:4-hydroxy-3-methylbut-2-enyl diphosphate reductase [Clostridiales Family XIII bacterium]